MSLICNNMNMIRKTVNLECKTCLQWMPQRRNYQSDREDRFIIFAGNFMNVKQRYFPRDLNDFSWKRTNKSLRDPNRAAKFSYFICSNVSDGNFMHLIVGSVLVLITILFFPGWCARRNFPRPRKSFGSEVVSERRHSICPISVKVLRERAGERKVAEGAFQLFLKDR